MRRRSRPINFIICSNFADSIPRATAAAITMPIENLDKMKVAELRAELAKLGMDTKGTKPILLARLKEALANMPEEGTTFYQLNENKLPLHILTVLGKIFWKCI